MSGWMWAGVALGLLIVLGITARRHFHRCVRKELLDLLRERSPDTQVLRETQDAIVIRQAGGESVTMRLANLYSAVAQGSRDPAGQRETIRGFVTSLISAAREAARPLSLEADGDRLMPRLGDVSLARQAASQGLPLVQRETPVPGLLILYVLDSEDSVRYVCEEHLAELGIDDETLHQRALANLARQPITEIVRGVIEHKRVAVVKLGGTFDATRLLLVPEALKDGEELVAVIPDRETLALMPVPSNDGWMPVRKLARMPATSYLLLDRPLRVTRAGFSVA